MRFKHRRRLIILATFIALLVSSCSEREDDASTRGLFAPDEDGNTNLTGGSESNAPACRVRVTPSTVFLGQKFSAVIDIFGMTPPIELYPIIIGPMLLSLDGIGETRFLSVYRMDREISSASVEVVDATGQSFNCTFNTKLVVQ